MLLDLPGHSLKKRLSCQLCFQAGFLSLNGVLHPRQELLRPTGMNRMAVRAAIPLHPQSLGKPDKLPKNEAMAPIAVCFHTRDNIQVFSSGTASQALEVFPKLSDK
jgi:hypothetical protein